MRISAKVLIFLLGPAIESPSLADDLDPKGLVFSPGSATGSLHSLTEEQCWRVLDSYSFMDATGRARIEGIAAQCRLQTQGKQKPSSLAFPPSDRALQPMQAMPQATQPMIPQGGGNIIEPMQPVK